MALKGVEELPRPVVEGVMLLHQFSSPSGASACADGAASRMSSDPCSST